MSASYRDDLLEFFEEHYRHDRRVRIGKMMGHPGFRVASNGKFFLLLYDDGIALKLPPERYELELRREEVTPFQPMNDSKPMSTWVVVTRAEAYDYEEERELIDSARRYTEAGN